MPWQEDASQKAVVSYLVARKGFLSHKISIQMNFAIHLMWNLFSIQVWTVLVTSRLNFADLSLKTQMLDHFCLHRNNLRYVHFIFSLGRKCQELRKHLKFLFVEFFRFFRVSNDLQFLKLFWVRKKVLLVEKRRKKHFLFFNRQLTIFRPVVWFNWGHLKTSFLTFCEEKNSKEKKIWNWNLTRGDLQPRCLYISPVNVLRWVIYRLHRADWTERKTFFMECIRWVW